MCKKWRSYLSLLVCVCFISSMLFLDTLEVKAFTILDTLGSSVCSCNDATYDAFQGNFYFNGSNTISYITSSSGTESHYSSSSTISMSFTHNQTGFNTYNFHFKVPYFFGVPDTGNITLYSDRYYATFLADVRITPTLGTVSNISVATVDGKMLSTSYGSTVPVYYSKATSLLNSKVGETRWVVGPYGYIEFDWSYATSTVYSTGSSTPTNVIFTPSYDCFIYNVNNEYIDSIGQTTSDSLTHEQLNELNNTQESIKDTAEDTNSKITDFFGNFFSNLIGVFVPESDYFSNWFTRVNDLLADKLGILYFPFDFIIDTLTTINSNSSTTSGQIIFPEMSFTNNATSETYILLNRQVINLNDYDVPFTSSENSSLVGTSNFTSLLSIIRLFTGIAFTFALVHLFIDKLHLILRGSERG